MVHGKLNKLVCDFSNCVRTFRTEKSLHLHAKKHLKMQEMRIDCWRYLLLKILVLFCQSKSYFLTRPIIFSRIVVLSFSKCDFMFNYSMFFLECTKRNLYNSAPEHHSKMRIAPLERAQKTIFLCLFLIFCCNLKFFYHTQSKNIEISNNYGKEKKRTLCFPVFCLTMGLS